MRTFSQEQIEAQADALSSAMRDLADLDFDPDEMPADRLLDRALLRRARNADRKGSLPKRCRESVGKDLLKPGPLADFLRDPSVLPKAPPGRRAA